MSKGKRVGIIGAGNVGSTVAYSLAMKGSCHEIILRDNKVEIAKGKALDMSQAAAAVRSHTVVSVAEEISELSDCDVVVVTAGSPRLPGMSRDDLLMINAKITKEVMAGVKKYSPDAIVILVTNPLDAMVYTAVKTTGFARERIIGMAGILDGSRMASFIQEKLGYGGGQIRASVMGGHGDDMVPLPRYSTVAGVPLTDVLTDEEIEEIVQRTRNGGAEIVEYLQTGSAYYAPGKSAAIMVEAILNDTKQIHPCAILLDGEYNQKEVVTGVPIMIGAGGAEKIIEVTLNEKEEIQFQKSVASVKSLIDTLHNNKFFN
jgi:malate dehydrogenase